MISVVPASSLSHCTAVVGLRALVSPKMTPERAG
ncbi:hypothetical protein BJY22_005564 [Kribbella shirazensis]|uniref:Uncharacterized protein n=1 Tax=Kribbella shirazensis TaxID=1105143 RepID=A0A7X5VET7_9ACTN|nr:hypothetical protein [Kribbella shirazensis]